MNTHSIRFTARLKKPVDALQRDHVNVIESFCYEAMKLGFTVTWYLIDGNIYVIDSIHN